MKTIEVDKEVVSYLVRIVDDRIRFIDENLRRNPGPLSEERLKLKSFFKVIDGLSVEK
jgi:hypothetical protein